MRLTDRIIELVYRRDFEYAELQGGWVAILWGLWLLNPWVDVFAVDGWRTVAGIAPDHIWGTALLVVGGGQLLGLLFRNYRCRRAFALSAAALWIAFGTLLGLDKPFRLTVPSCWMFFIGAAWGYLRIGMLKNRTPAAHPDKQNGNAV